MGLRKQYDEGFERVWRNYPMWPVGRSKKELAAREFQKLKLSAGDVDELITIIDRMKRDRATWQKGYLSRDGRPIGPQGLQVFLAQRGWQDEYVKWKTAHQAVKDAPVDQPEWVKRGISEDEYRARVQAAKDQAMRELRMH